MAAYTNGGTSYLVDCSMSAAGMKEILANHWKKHRYYMLPSPATSIRDTLQRRAFRIYAFRWKRYVFFRSAQCSSNSDIGKFPCNTILWEVSPHLERHLLKVLRMDTKTFILGNPGTIAWNKFGSRFL
jgi:hypothetical protein